MPHKRAHKKSRYGCDQCRRRRVKCDERLPACSNCLQREEPCHFSRPPGVEPSGPSETKLKDDRAISLECLLTEVSLDDTRFRELELMHHWCTKTCSSFTPIFIDVMRHEATREAFQHPYLMEAILALTSLHIAVEDAASSPNPYSPSYSARQHVNAALTYQNRAVNGLQVAFSQLSTQNCAAVLLASFMLLACATVGPLLPASWNDQTTPTAEAMLSVINFIRGIKGMVEQFKPWFSQSPFAGLIWDRTLFSTVRECCEDRSNGRGCY
jgi:hypothetical protein